MEYDLTKKIAGRLHGRSIILITGHGDVDMAVAAMKIGAFDFIEKPFDEARLLASIHQAADKKRKGDSAAAELSDLQVRFDALSIRQREVMELAVAGLSSKEIGNSAQNQSEDRREPPSLGDGARWRSQSRRSGEKSSDDPGAHAV